MWQCTVVGATSAPRVNPTPPRAGVVPRGVRCRAAAARGLGWQAASAASAVVARRARVATRPRVHATCGPTEPGSAQRAFHQRRMQGDARCGGGAAARLAVHVRPATADELPVVATLRARAFYVYPPDRAWAGKRMQAMEAEKELLRLRSVAAGALEGGERVTTFVGVVPAAEVRAPARSLGRRALREMAGRDETEAGRRVCGARRLGTGQSSVRGFDEQSFKGRFFFPCSLEGAGRRRPPGPPGSCCRWAWRTRA